MIDDSEKEYFWHYHTDQENNLNRSISTRDLICWSYQIASGMNYLSSKKVSFYSSN